LYYQGIILPKNLSKSKTQEGISPIFFIIPSPLQTDSEMGGLLPWITQKGKHKISLQTEYRFTPLVLGTLQRYFIYNHCFFFQCYMWISPGNPFRFPDDLMKKLFATAFLQIK
jgi:hypothetical protein